MDKIQFGNRSVSVPRDWNELTAHQLEALADLASKGLTEQKIKLYFVFFLLDLHVLGKDSGVGFIIGRHLRRFTLTSSQVCTLASTQSYLLSKKEDELTGKVQLFFDSRLTIDPYRHTLYKSPGAALENLSYEQFMFCLYYQQRMETDAKFLTHLLACLWHKRRKFRPEDVDKDAGRISRLPFQRQQVMFWYWQGSMAFLKARFPRVFSSGKDSKEKSRNVFEDQLRVVDALAGGDMTKKPMVREGYLYDALFSMDESLRRQEELESKVK